MAVAAKVHLLHRFHLPSLDLPSLGLPSLGLPSLGLPSLGLPSLGLLSFGLLSFGLLSFGLLSLGLLSPDLPEGLELVRELLGDPRCQGLGNHVHVTLHCLPGLRLGGVVLSGKGVSSVAAWIAEGFQLQYVVLDGVGIVDGGAPIR